MSKPVKSNVAAHPIERHIRVIRGQKVMLGTDLAALYEVPARVLNQAVRRNLRRFPEEFMFQLTTEEGIGSKITTVTLAASHIRGEHTYCSNSSCLASTLVTPLDKP